MYQKPLADAHKFSLQVVQFVENILELRHFPENWQDGSFYSWMNVWVAGKTVRSLQHVPFLGALEVVYDDVLYKSKGKR